MHDHKVALRREKDSRQQRFLSNHKRFSLETKSRRPSEMRELGDKQGDPLLSIIDREVLYARDHGYELAVNMSKLIQIAQDNGD